MLCLGLDWGKKKIGLAIGSEEIKIASPFLILDVKAWDKTKAELTALINREGIAKLVIGRPTYLSGRDAGSLQFRQFLEFLQSLGLPLVEIDERFSTKAAASIGKILGINRGGRDDADAAAVILQTYFDSLP